MCIAKTHNENEKKTLFKTYNKFHVIFIFISFVRKHRINKNYCTLERDRMRQQQHEIMRKDLKNWVKLNSFVC